MTLLCLLLLGARWVCVAGDHQVVEWHSALVTVEEHVVKAVQIGQLVFVEDSCNGMDRMNN